MVNTVSAAIQIAAEKPRTAPRYLVKIEFDDPLHISTAGEITYNGQTYTTERGCLVGAVNAQGSTITLDNSGGDLTDLFNAGVQDTPVTIYLYYTSDATPRASLFISGWRSDNDNQIIVDLSAEPSRVTRLPSIRFVADPGNNKLNYMPRSGDMITTGLVTTTFE